MTWQTGLILLCLVLIAIYAFAEAADLLLPRWIKRLQRLERARADWEARCVESQAFWRTDK